MKIAIDTTIFRDYDIRGIYPSQLNEQTYYIIGRSLVQYLNPHVVAVGHDARLSSPTLTESFIKGITDSGCDVVNLGLISTEMTYFASGKYDYPVCAVISASHNPAEYNGLKIVLRKVVPLHGQFGLPEIKQFSLAQAFPTPPKKGTVTKRSILDEWVVHLLSLIDVAKIKPLTVVVDAGNGMGGLAWEKLKDRIPIKLIPLYFEPDGRFPHHLADPLKEENLQDLRKKIIETKADLGFAHDGDSDRMFAVDDKGEIISGTLTTAILATHLLKKYGPNPVLYNVVCGKIVPETIRSLGGTPIRVRVGHSFTKEAMKKHNALLAGEHSGHFYFKENYFADSSTLAALHMLEYRSIENVPLSEIVARFQKYSSSGEKNFKVVDTAQVIQTVKTVCNDAQSTDEIDGLSIWYPDYWFNLRASKTEPLLRLNLEGDTKEIMESQLGRITAIISKFLSPQK